MIQAAILFNNMISSMNVEGLSIPVSFIKFYKKSETIPSEVLEYETEEISLTSCQAMKQASLNDAILLTKNNIGCIAAAITFGLVEQLDDTPLMGSRVYTDIMKEQIESESDFTPPSPKDFTEGRVYACKDSKMPGFCLFGKDDSGRFRNVEIAKKAISQMTAIQPPIMQGVFFYSTGFEDIDIEPDIVVMSVRPIELTRIVQAYQFNSGERVTGNMGPVRVVNSDLIVRPYLENKINFSSYCVGARLIASYDPNHLGIGMPFTIFKEVVTGMEESKTGYPFQLYPGA